ncbi:uncharacterized protein LOC142157659 isoform X2 [Mixophyes fleayi]|uniref:uncharacterized protein LOC142157659 isoform X2 n=1 Tax=Mixophyes fleayi TaxID=3061075 RepID=UPI003F4E0948
MDLKDHRRMFPVKEAWPENRINNTRNDFSSAVTVKKDMDLKDHRRMFPVKEAWPENRINNTRNDFSSAVTVKKDMDLKDHRRMFPVKEAWPENRINNTRNDFSSAVTATPVIGMKAHPNISQVKEAWPEISNMNIKKDMQSRCSFAESKDGTSIQAITLSRSEAWSFRKRHRGVERETVPCDSKERQSWLRHFRDMNIKKDRVFQFTDMDTIEDGESVCTYVP